MPAFSSPNLKFFHNRWPKVNPLWETPFTYSFTATATGLVEGTRRWSMGRTNPPSTNMGMRILLCLNRSRPSLDTKQVHQAIPWTPHLCHRRCGIPLWAWWWWHKKSRRYAWQISVSKNHEHAPIRHLLWPRDDWRASVRRANRCSCPLKHLKLLRPWCWPWWHQYPVWQLGKMMICIGLMFQTLH